MPAHRLLLALLSSSLFASPPAWAQTQLRVEFTTPGECLVTTAGSVARVAVRVGPSPAERRCPIPPLAKPDAVTLDVVLPRAERRPGDEFPRLAWTERDGRWVGTARLPAPPAFVRLTRDTGGAIEGPRRLDFLTILAALAAGLWAVRKGRAM